MAEDDRYTTRFLLSWMPEHKLGLWAIILQVALALIALALVL